MLGIPKFEWVSNSPDFNPIEHIWALLKRRIQRRRASERVTTVTDMKAVLVEEWEKITVEEINWEIDKLPTIVMHCLSVNGGNNFHAWSAPTPSAADTPNTPRCRHPPTPPACQHLLLATTPYISATMHHHIHISSSFFLYTFHFICTYTVPQWAVFM